MRNNEGIAGATAAVLLLLSLGGCSTKPEAYYEVLREQRSTYREVTAILAEVQDEKSMADARAKLQVQFEKYEATSRKAAALPSPPPDEVKERFREETPSLQRAIDDMKAQIGRVQSLKGGKAFFKQFETSSSGLFNAVQP